MASRFALHCEKWGKGCGHEQCSMPGTRVCLVRGKLPCDIFFCGEAPGESENVLGIPFQGQAGRLLDDIIAKGVYRDYPTLKIAIGNLVGCIPRVDEEGENDKRAGAKAGEPDDDQVRKCGPRLIELIDIAQPKLIVCVGKLAKDWLTPNMKDCIAIDREIPRVHILHPSWILSKCPPQMKSIKVQECIVTINNAIEELGL